MALLHDSHGRVSEQTLAAGRTQRAGNKAVSCRPKPWWYGSIIMRRVLASLVLFCACAGPTQQQLAETAATAPPPKHTNAPPATASENDRDGLVRSFDDMQTTQQARREVQNDHQTTKPTPHRIGPAQDIQPVKSTKRKRSPNKPRRNSYRCSRSYCCRHCSRFTRS